MKPGPRSVPVGRQFSMPGFPRNIASSAIPQSSPNSADIQLSANKGDRRWIPASRRRFSRFLRHSRGVFSSFDGKLVPFAFVPKGSSEAAPFCDQLSFCRVFPLGCINFSCLRARGMSDARFSGSFEDVKNINSWSVVPAGVGL